MRHAHRGYTLMELLAASASASVLMVGLSSALFVASQALDIDDGPMASRMQGGLGVERLLADAQTALRFNERSSRALEFTVPDITGDDVVDTLRYEWSGTPGDPLLRQVNGGEQLVVTPGIQSLNFRFMDRKVTATDVTVAPGPDWPVLESFAFEDQSINATSIEIAAPAGIERGDLLIGCVTIENNYAGSVSPPSGWTEIHVDEQDNKVTLGVWWKIASGSEPPSYEWNWTKAEQPIGLVMRISNQYAGNPITTFASNKGLSEEPACRSVATVLANSMVLRIGGFEKAKIDNSDPGLDGHTRVYMGAGDNNVSLGAGYEILEPASDSGAATFQLTGIEEFCTVSIAIAPEQK